MTWEDKYNLAKVYYETYGNLEIPVSFKTFNGKDYDENGYALGIWIVHNVQVRKKVLYHMKEKKCYYK